MILLRSLIYQCFLILSTALWSSAILVLQPLNHAWGLALGRSWARVNLAALRWLCGLDYRVCGAENLPNRGPGVVLSKHQSAWETIALLLIVPLEQSWVLKRELIRIPIFGWALARYRPIPVDRKAGRKAAAQLIRSGLQVLKDGRWIVMFPEGTRVAAGQVGNYSASGALLAERSGHPIVPIAHNAGEFWARRSLRKYPGVIDVVIGPVIEPNGRKPAEIMAEVSGWIESTVATLPRRTMRD